MTDDEKIIFCRIVGTLLVADLKLHDAEIRYLEDLYEKLDVAQAQREEIETAININDDIKELAADLSLDTCRELLKELHNAAWADGVLMRPEAQIIVAVEELLSARES